MTTGDRIAYVYVDEYGTPSLEIEKAGVTQYFIYTAVIIPSNEIASARLIRESIIKDSFPQQGVIKSATIPNNANGFAKQLDGLTKLNSLSHHVIALIVDKGCISQNSGLSIKQSFIKYFQRLLSVNFFECFDEFHIIADETGWPEFNRSLESYMRDTAGIEPSLFSNNSFKTSNDITGEPLLQIADFYAGVLGRYYCGKYDENRAMVINNIVRSRVSIEWFPNDSISIIASSVSFDQSFDLNLYRLAIESAEQYLSLSPQDHAGCELVEYMLQESRRYPQRHISSKEIKAHLNQLGIEVGDPIVKISELRDHGVIIISPIGKKGYKFPTNEREVADFLNRLSCNVIPQLKRGYLLNKLLAEKSFGKYNVLYSSPFETLNQLCKLVEKQM